MQLLHSRGSYSREHGANLRKERRAFATEKAGILARAGMAEVERQQTGETRRAKMEQKTESKKEAGLEKRHEREYGRPWGARPEMQQGFRYAELAAKQKGGLRGAGGGAGSFTSSQMANLRKSAYGEADKEIVRRKEMGELSFGSGKNRIDMTSEQIAEEREAIAAGYLQDYTGGGLQQAGKQQPVGGMQGRGRVVTEGGRQFDIMPGAEGFQRSTASPGMMETAGFLPQGMGEGSMQIEGTEPGAGGMQEIAPETPKLKPGEAAAMLQAEYNKENPDPNIIASLKKLVGGGMQWLKGRMLSPGGGRVESPVGLKGYMNR